MDGQDKSFLQSEEWADFQRSIGRKVFDVQGVKVIKHELPFGKSYLYAPHLSSIVDFEDLAKQENSIFVKVEPLQDDIAQQYVKLGFQRSNKTIQPHKTVVLDLARSENELLSAMHHKTRYNIKVAEKNGIHVSRSMDHETFWELMQKTTERDKFHSHPKGYYEKLLKLCELFVAYKNSTPVAAAMILTHGNIAYYLHGASDYEYRSLMAPYLLHWHIIQTLQATRCTTYDFWGIDAQKWPGVTRFKLGWTGHTTGSGGRVIEYPGAFDLTISPFWKFAYDIMHL